MERDLNEIIHIDSIVLAIDPEKNQKVARFAIENENKTKIKFLHNSKVYNQNEIKFLEDNYGEGTKLTHKLSLILMGSLFGRGGFSSSYFSYEELYTLKDLECNPSIELGKLLKLEKEFVTEQEKAVISLEKQKKEKREKKDFYF